MLQCLTRTKFFNYGAVYGAGDGTDCPNTPLLTNLLSPNTPDTVAKQKSSPCEATQGGSKPDWTDKLKICKPNIPNTPDI